TCGRTSAHTRPLRRSRLLDSRSGTALRRGSGAGATRPVLHQKGGTMYDPQIDPDEPGFLDSLRERGLDEEQIEQAQNHLRFLRDMSPEQREAHEQQSNDVAMGMSLVPRFTDSRGLLAINFLARERGYNRVLDEEEIVKLDP